MQALGWPVVMSSGCRMYRPSPRSKTGAVMAVADFTATSAAVVFAATLRPSSRLAAIRRP